MKIIFIQTGGTIDKDYPKTTEGWAFEFGEPAIRRILEKLDPAFEYQIITSCQKDSLELTDKDREHLANLIINENGKKFIVSHGTDTMIATASYLSDRIRDKLVIITGAMRPERFSNSDAPINVGCAVASANLLDRGVYITMQGIVKPYCDIARDLVTGKFY